MRAIWRFPVTGPDQFDMTVPGPARGVHVGLKHGKPQLWVEVSPGGNDETLTFRVVPTGAAYAPEWEHVGTFILDEGDLVFHVVQKGAGS